MYLRRLFCLGCRYNAVGSVCDIDDSVSDAGDHEIKIVRLLLAMLMTVKNMYRNSMTMLILM